MYSSREAYEENRLNYHGASGEWLPDWDTYQSKKNMSYYQSGNRYNGRRSGFGYKRSSSWKRSTRPHSGCSVRKDFVSKSGERKDLFIKGWKYTKRTGIWSFVAVPAKMKYQKGKQHVTMVVKITSRLGTTTEWGHWNPTKQILSIPSMRVAAGNGWVSYITPKSFKR